MCRGITPFGVARFTFALRWTDARLTPAADHSRVTGKRTTGLLLVVAAAGALATGASAAAGPLGPIGKLPAGWSHAQINVVIKHQPHTLTYDRGRVTSVSPTELTLRERDGVVVTVPVSSATRVNIYGRPASLAQLRRRMAAVTVSIDGAPAAVVRVPA